MACKSKNKIKTEKKRGAGEEKNCIVAVVLLPFSVTVFIGCRVSQLEDNYETLDQCVKIDQPRLLVVEINQS